MRLPLTLRLHTEAGEAKVLQVEDMSDWAQLPDHEAAPRDLACVVGLDPRLMLEVRP
jgi:hypothetical protein